MWRVGIVGAGAVVAKSYLPNLAGRADCRVAAIASAGGATARELAARHGIATVHGDWRALVADPGVDLVCICTPTRLHREMAEAAMAAGKAVLLEKPVAPALADSQALLRAATDQARPFHVTFNQVFREENAWLVSRAREGALGDLEWLDMQWQRPPRPGEESAWQHHRRQAGGGVLLDLGPHLLHLGLSMLRERRFFSAWGQALRHNRGPDPVEDTFVGGVVVDGGPTLHLRLAWDSPGATRVAFAACGTRGSAATTEYTGERSTGWPAFFDHLFASLDAGAHGDLDLALDVMTVIDALYRAALAGGVVAGRFHTLGERA